MHTKNGKEIMHANEPAHDLANRPWLSVTFMALCFDLQDSDLKNIHFNFGEMWRVSENDSKFIYKRGESYMTYFQPKYQPYFLVPSSNSEAELFCGGNQVFVYIILYFNL